MTTLWYRSLPDSLTRDIAKDLQQCLPAEDSIRHTCSRLKDIHLHWLGWTCNGKLLDRGLRWSGYDYCLKCSHIFNLLDARKAISVAERTRYIGRIRNIARQVAEQYSKQRQEMGYPLLQKQAGWPTLFQKLSIIQCIGVSIIIIPDSYSETIRSIHEFHRKISVPYQMAECLP